MEVGVAYGVPIRSLSFEVAASQYRSGFLNLLTDYQERVRVVYVEANYGEGIFRVALDGDPHPEVVPQLHDILPSRAWFIDNGDLYYFDLHDTEKRLHRFNLLTVVITEVTRALPRIAFQDGTLSYAPEERLLIYSRWSEATGSQIMSLRWK